MGKADKIKKIKEKVKIECNKLGVAPKWFFEVHILAVEKYARFLLAKLPKANRDIVMLAVWLHDLQRIRGPKNGDYEKIGAKEAERVMNEFGYESKIIKQVKEIILTHSCDDEMPKTLEGKIITTADAMSRYTNDFFLRIARKRLFQSEIIP